jgi:serine/threonine-protein kinase
LQIGGAALLSGNQDEEPMPEGCEHCGQAHEGESAFCPMTGKLIASRLFPPGTLLEGKYRVERTLGVGGMGAVFQAVHTLLDKRVAVKVILPGVSADEHRLRDRLIQEARVASATGHPNITSVTDMGHTPEGNLFVVMEYLDGKTLRQLLEEQEALPVAHAARLMKQVLSGLEMVHRKGIVHRDLKPDNLMLVTGDDGEEVLKILDFGIAKIVQAEKGSGMTMAGLVMGTPQYMSPEQAQAAEDIDHRSDLYAAGAILYQMTTGTVPFREESLAAIVAATLKGEIEPPSRRRPGLPRELDYVIARAMARDREERYPDARDFQQALEPLTREEAARPAQPDSQTLAFGDLDESALGFLDEVSSPGLSAPIPAKAPARPPQRGGAAASAAAPAPATPAPEPVEDRHAPRELDPGGEPETVGLDEASRFRPPEEELDDLSLDVERPRPPTPRPAPAPAPSASEPLRAPGPLAAESTGRITGPYGQARKQSPARAGLWIALAVVALGGGGLYLYTSSGSKPPPSTESSAPQRVRITFNVNPAFAEILVDNVTLPGRELTLKRGGGEYKVTVKANGYLTRSLVLKPEQDQTVQIELKPRPPENP